MTKSILLTGGAGFIGSAVARIIIDRTPHRVLVVDALTYAGNPDNLASVTGGARFAFMKIDIADTARMQEAIASFAPDVIMHLAAETHVDRSIDGPGQFVRTNIIGTYSLLQVASDYWRSLPLSRKHGFRFHHISTDEVFGSLGAKGFFTETTPYQPRSPYSASKAASDHLVRAWHHTYGLPVIVSTCSNNYGPYQFPEKLIPLSILNALDGRPLPVYGKGENVRDWLHVDDHAFALLTIADRGKVGDTYNVGGGAEKTNLEVVRMICAFVDELAPDTTIGPRENLISFVADRPGHDLRYAIDATKIRRELGWVPHETFETGLRKTVEWYLRNKPWWERIRSGVYRGERLGVTA